MSNRVIITAEMMAELHRELIIDAETSEEREELLGIVMACMYTISDNDRQVFCEHCLESESIIFYIKDKDFYIKVDEYSLRSAKEGVYDELEDDEVIDICDLTSEDIYDYTEDTLADLLEVNIAILKRALAKKDQEAIEELVRNITDITNKIQLWGNAIVTYTESNAADFEGYLVLNGDYKVVDAFTENEELTAHI